MINISMIWKAFWMMICLKITSTQWFVLIWNIFCNKKSSLFHWEVFHEINVNQTTLKLYTSWMHGKNQHRSTIIKHALLRNKCEYQHSADIFVRNIFNPFHGTGLFLYSPRKAEVSWCFHRALKETSVMKWVKSDLIFTYFLTCISNWR